MKMKTALAVGLGLVVTATAFSQGTIYFSTAGVGVNAPITNILTLARIPSGSTFLAQLYYGAAGISDEALLRPATNNPSGFASPGYIVNGASPYFLDPTVVDRAQVGSFQVRAWQASLGAEWAAAYATWLTGAQPTAVLGKSGIVQIKTGDPVGPPPTLPPNVTGLQGFYLQPVPEPGVLALGALGLVALLWRRRK